MQVPSWARTVRFRLALISSALLFAVSALLVAGVYLAVSQTVDAKPLEGKTIKKVVKINGEYVLKEGETFEAADIGSLQQAVNQGTLDTLGAYSGVALGALFLVSLGIGWWVSGRVLRPIGEITTTTREITASDLSRRIPTTGPRDELRTLAETINDMLQRLQDSFAAQRHLVDDVSHELRNPVAVVRTNVDAVLGHDDATPDQRHQAAAVVSRATQRIATILDDLLATARQRSGAFDEEEVDLSVLATEVVEEHRLASEERSLRLQLRLERGPVVVADRQALIRVLDNLMANAVRLSPVGGTLTVAVGSRRGWAWVAVRDDGPGIEPADQERVFDRYFSSRVPGEDPAAHAGSGIGLTIARQAVEAHGGRLALSSRPGVGSTFVIWLPDRSPATPGKRDQAAPSDDPLGRLD
ncbi:histidine kinase [Marmoricola sp. Leaf446]|nr:histidine kinase [Marmoricola sp. Leaf446]